MSRYPRAHGKPAGVKNIRPGQKIRPKLPKDERVSEKHMNNLMRDLEGEHRSIYANPYTRTQQQRREKRLTNKPL